MSDKGGEAERDDFSEMDSDDALIEEMYAPLIGPEYYDIVDHKERIEECLNHPDVNHRALALTLCKEFAALSFHVEERIMELAKGDPLPLIRALATIALSGHAMRLHRVGSAQAKLLLRFFARVALDQSEDDLVRRAAYGSAVLAEPDLGKVKHVLRGGKFLAKNFPVADFDLAYLRETLAL